MKRILITGVSGVGKSTVVAQLRRAGHDAIDLDDNDWSHWVKSADGNGPTPDRPGEDWVWREDRLHDLLTTDRDKDLYISGCSPNVGVFLPRIDRVVLLTAPAETMAERLATRTTNTYGNNPEELARSLDFKATVEPLLRTIADEEIDTTAPLDEILRRILA